MPANLTPEYRQAETTYREAKTSEEKLQALEYMLQVIPKHKGTDHLQADLKRKLAKLKAGGEKKGASSRRSAMFNISKEGAAQLTLVGAPNGGKSAMVKHLTNASPIVEPYPYSTFKPLPGMMPFENIQIQLVDLPPIGRDRSESWVPGVVRNSDMALLVVNLADHDLLDGLEFALEKLEEGKVLLVKEVEQRYMPDGKAQVKTLMVGTHLDQPDALDNLEILKEFFGERFPIAALSVLDQADQDAFRKYIFDQLKILRVYTKARSKKADFTKPVILPIGSTLLDFARQIHKDFARDLKFARIWGKEKYDGQKVQRDYLLVDGDIIELHL